MGINQMNAILSLYGIEIAYIYRKRDKTVRVYVNDYPQTLALKFSSRMTNPEIVKRLIEELT